MRILVYGAGVLGCNLARDFFKAGKDVTLLARGKWAETIKTKGLCIKNYVLPVKSTVRVPVVLELASEDEYDVIFVAVRYTQVATILDALRANKSKNVVFLGNNVQPEKLVTALPDLKKITIGQLCGAQSNEQLMQKIFAGTGYKVTYEPNMGDYLLCHAAFVLPVAFACYKTDGDLKRLKGDTAYFNKMADANVEGYRALKNNGHAILPKDDEEFEGEKYRKTCVKFFTLMCATGLGKVCASDHAMNAIEEMSTLNRDLKKLFEENGAAYPVWKEMEKDAEKYLQK